MQKIKDNSKAIREAEARRGAIRHELNLAEEELTELHAAEYGVKIGSRVSFKTFRGKTGSGTVVTLAYFHCGINADKADGTPGTFRRTVFYSDIINVEK